MWGDAVLASIWLQPTGQTQEILRTVIGDLASRHGTAPFPPHLTVCSARDLDPVRTEAAADYVRRSGLLPIAVRKLGISYSTKIPFRAVVIDVENAAELHSFREALRRIAGSAALGPPHISLLYTIAENGERVGWWSDRPRLRAIAEECVARIPAAGFVLDHPVIVAPDGDWTNINSWKSARSL
jgi:hypothetical protein